MAATIKQHREIEAMRKAGHVVSVIHQRIEAAIAPGVTTMELDMIARDTMMEFGAGSSFLGHLGFPGRICASVNEEIVHGIPSPRVLRDGDIISVDVGATTYGVGRISDEARELLRVTEESLYLGLAQARAGNRLGAIGHAVESYATSLGYGLVREYGGHGIGRSMWEEPHVANHGRANVGLQLRAGMTLAIEPMINCGVDETEQLADGWTVVTQDRRLSAHFEHTVLVRSGEPEILTKRLVKVVH